MIEFVLMVQICNSYDGDCMWQRVGRFRTENVCVANGLAIDPAVVRFKCVEIEQRKSPGESRSRTQPPVPLPRPRPPGS
jgi:hypothetical protein